MAGGDEASNEGEIEDRVAASPFHAAMGISVASVREGDGRASARGPARPRQPARHGARGRARDARRHRGAGLAVRSAIEPGAAT